MAVQYTDYSRIEQEICELYGLVYADATAVLIMQIRQHVSRHLQEKWRMWFGEGTMRSERREYRAGWLVSTSYVVGDEVFYPLTSKYYYCTKAHTSATAPADAAGVTDNDEWVDALAGYSGSDYLAATAYVAGDIVLHAVNGLYYACHTASTGNLPTDTSYWGVLNDGFEKYIAWEQVDENSVSLTKIGLVRKVTNKNSRLKKNYTSYRFDRTEDGILCVGGPAQPWLDFQIRPPELYGSAFDATVAYTGGADQILFTESNGRKNYYDCITTTSAAESPATAAAKWAIAGIPYYLKTFLTYVCAADLCRMDRREDDAMSYEAIAERHWEDELDRLAGLQGITNEVMVANC